MRRITWVLIVVLVVVAALSGCGEKSADQVVSDLSKRSEKMKGYKSKGKMVIHSGTSPQEYEVEVWYKKPHYYRVSLKNTKKDVTQILLRNDEGVYVLTPHLEKSFRFQSDWPENGGQVYLYQSLLNSIIDDTSRKMIPSEKTYQFEVLADYSQNQAMNKQRIWLDKDYHPEKVEVLNEEEKVMVEVHFDRFEPNASFDKDAFEKDRNMTGVAGRTVPTMSQKEKQKSQENKAPETVTPAWVPEGSQLTEETTVDTPDGKTVIMRYKGKTPFTLTQKRPAAMEASLPVYGKPYSLDYTVGVLLETEGKKKRMSWTYEGVEYQLIGKLSEETMGKIARSVFEQQEK
ncbi:MAG: DUF4367 domain-containing protein [Firmicutes bacterium]|uniref:Outer membrane lipoprotein-sorting protein n=1 Tax=Melghirimyces thermohalophilus TaxID=1236220 RepID=A0A1G6N8R2_9BACL|nr:outer membrane lipoprotein-sorting protein [Melghirimyces thermohalophilus]MDA8352486.1 DUF4367 domain-containing protein [Bacillota bacterium]SDC63646.1 Outer membrane lipoprotein-sorting protein [Melghirimyces thermohalophilus]